MKITKNAVGTEFPSTTITDRNGSGFLAIQVDVTGTINYDIVGKVAPEAAAISLKTNQTGSFLETIAWVPFIGIKVNSVSGGSATLYVAES